MKKFLTVSTLLVTAGIALAAGSAGSSGTASLSRGTVLNPFTLQVVSAIRVSSSKSGGTTTDLPVDGPRFNPLPLDPEDVRPGPFTPPPRSPYAPPPR